MIEPDGSKIFNRLYVYVSNNRTTNKDIFIKVSSNRYRNIARDKNKVKQIDDSNFAPLSDYVALPNDVFSSRALEALYKLYDNKFTVSDIKPTEKVKTTMKKANTDAAKAASQLVAGKAFNKQLQKRIKKVAPLAVKGYVKNPLVTLAVANLVNYAVDKFAEDRTDAKWVAEAMMAAAMAEVMTSFDIEGMLNGFLEEAKKKQK